MRRNFARACIAMFVVCGVVLGVVQLTRGNWPRFLLGLASALFLLVPPLFRRLFGGHPYGLYALGFLFCIFSYDFGSVLLLFDTVPAMDKAAHFLSGFVFTTMGYCFFLGTNHRQLQSAQANWQTGIPYALGFSAFIAIAWEVFEFCGFVFFGMDSQHHLDTGVFDTMGDLITCLVGSLLCAASWLLTVKRGRRLITGWAIEDFYEVLHRRGKPQV